MFACAVWATLLSLLAASPCCATGSCTNVDCRPGGDVHGELSSIESPAHPDDDEVLQSTSLLQVGHQFGSTQSRVAALTEQKRWEDVCEGMEKAMNPQWGLGFDSHFPAGLDHSQMWQSSILHRAFFANGGARRGTVVELGASNGINGSNSFAFSEGLGWHAILLEANPESAVKLKQNRPRAEVHAPVAISTMSGRVNFTMCAYPDVSVMARIGFEDWSEEEFEAWCQPKAVVQVPTEPLSSFLKNTPEVDILFLDVEGAELMVLETIDFSTTKIHVANIEKGCPGSAVGKFMESKGFVFRGNIGPDFVWTDAATSPAPIT